MVRCSMLGVQTLAPPTNVVDVVCKAVLVSCTTSGGLVEACQIRASHVCRVAEGSDVVDIPRLHCTIGIKIGRSG